MQRPDPTIPKFLKPEDVADTVAYVLAAPPTVQVIFLVFEYLLTKLLLQFVIKTIYFDNKYSMSIFFNCHQAIYLNFYP